MGNRRKIKVRSAEPAADVPASMPARRPVRPGSLRAWWLAARPKTLTGALAPVLVGGALAWHEIIHTFDAGWMADDAVSRSAVSSRATWAFALCVVFAVLMQVAANFVNDYLDFRKGTDRADRLGPERACAQGWLTPAAMRRGIAAVVALAACAGLTLAFMGGWAMVLVGLGCIAACILYTTHLSYRGWGDVLVVVFFGIVPVFFTYWCMTGAWERLLMADALLLGLAVGLAADCLLMVNNYRDVEQDRVSGKRTLVVRFGRRAGALTYLWLGLAAAAIATVVIPKAAPTLAVYVLLHVVAYQKLLRRTGRELNASLGAAARNIFIFGALIAVFLFFV